MIDSRKIKEYIEYKDSFDTIDVTSLSDRYTKTIKRVTHDDYYLRPDWMDADEPVAVKHWSIAKPDDTYVLHKQEFDTYESKCTISKKLSPKTILKTLSALKGEIAINCAPIKIKYVECKMSPLIKSNLILAYKKLKMYDKSVPIIARFDEYGRRLPDEMNIDTLSGVVCKIVDPDVYGEFYLSLTAKKADDSLWDIPF